MPTVVIKKKNYVTRPKNKDKRYLVRKEKKGPEVKYVNIEEYKPRKNKGCVIV